MPKWHAWQGSSEFLVRSPLRQHAWKPAYTICSRSLPNNRKRNKEDDGIASTWRQHVCLAVELFIPWTATSRRGRSNWVFVISKCSSRLSRTQPCPFECLMCPVSPGGDGGRTRTAEAETWRKRRDSNPRYPFRYASFQDWSHQPLGHSSLPAVYRAVQRGCNVSAAIRMQGERQRAKYLCIHGWVICI